jgi:hypothetical protein
LHDHNHIGQIIAIEHEVEYKRKKMKCIFNVRRDVNHIAVESHSMLKGPKAESSMGCASFYTGAQVHGPTELFGRIDATNIH